MKKLLFIVPGLSSPFEDKYVPVYGLLTEEAGKFGYQRCEVVLLPGQRDHNGNSAGHLTLPSAVQRLRERLCTAEAGGETYRLLGLSFGASVCLAALADSARFEHLEKVVLWGPSPLWSSWRAFVAGEGRQLLAKSTALEDGEFFRTLMPVEYLVGKVTHRTLIAAGDQDPYCPPYFVNYLWNLAQAAGRRNVEFAVVTGVGHNVKRDDETNWKDYLSVMLD